MAALGGEAWAPRITRRGVPMKRRSPNKRVASPDGAGSRPSPRSSAKASPATPDSGGLAPLKLRSGISDLFDDTVSFDESNSPRHPGSLLRRGMMHPMASPTMRGGRDAPPTVSQQTPGSSAAASDTADTDDPAPAMTLTAQQQSDPG